MMTAASARPTTFISYAHDDDAHVEKVRKFYHLLCGNGIDADCDLPGDETPRDWTTWMTDQLRTRDSVLVVASPKYKERAEERGWPDVGRGARWEAWQIRSILYNNLPAARLRILPVVLEGRSAAELPEWLPISSTHYVVPELTGAGVEKLLRYMLGRPLNLRAVPGPPPPLPARPAP